jgi:hypothetical protein
MSKLVTRPEWCHPTYGYIGRIPKSAEGGLEWPRAAAFLRQQQTAYQTFAYSGPPDASYNPRNGNFYPIFRKPNPLGSTSTREYQIEILCWRGCLSEVDQAIEWYRDIDDVAVESVLFSKTIDTGENGDTWGDRAKGEYFSRGVTVDSAPSDDNTTMSFTASRIETTNIKLAAMSIWEDARKSYIESLQIEREWHNAPGSPIHGDNETAYPELGRLYSHTVVDGSMSQDSVEAATRRCLFQWGHPAGVWSDQNAFRQLIGSFVWPVFTRNLIRCATNSTLPVVLVPACVVTCDEDAEIKYTIGTSTWTWTAPATYATPTLIHGSSFTGDCLEAATGDLETRYCTIEIKAPSGGEILVHTVSLWEWLPYPATHSAPG